MSPHPVAIGVDVGGTFTDVVIIANGDIHATKVPTTPETPDEGVLDGIERALESQGIAPTNVDTISHGTTVATNALLEGTWADTALITTDGFEDVLEIGRQDRPSLYDLAAEKTDPIVPRERRFGVGERLDETGDVRTPLAEEDIDHMADAIQEADVEAVAIALLFAFENAAHERRLATGLQERGISVPVSRSSVVHPEIREYERTLVTAVNAALQPVVSPYLDRLRTRLDEANVDSPVAMMQSNGGTVAAEGLANQPVRGVLSGPAAGVQGAAAVAERVGAEDVITMDMGGTSCDVSHVAGGQPTVSTDVEVGPYPLRVPTVDVHTIGAGGGSIAWLDDGGALRVGPASAGADPGPICYGRGGTEPTITDAQVILGRLAIDRVATGTRVDAETVASRMGESVAEPMGSDVTQAAAGILSVADAAMARAIRVVSVERGHDPRECTLVAYGGAGPLHAASVASKLDIPRILVPPSAGMLSALGLLVADRVYDYATSHVRPLDEVDLSTVRDLMDGFIERGRSQLREDGIPEEDIAIERVLDLRYVGQAHEVRVPVPKLEAMDDPVEAVIERFHEAHEQRYGHANRGEPVELVTIRVRARGQVDSPDLEATGAQPSSDPSSRQVYFDGAWQETPVLARQSLRVDRSHVGPAIIQSLGSTLLVPPDWDATVHPTGSIMMEGEP